MFIHLNDFKKAIFLLNKAINILEERKNEDNYYEYFLKINFITLNYFLGHKKNLKKKLNDLFNKIPCLPDSDKELLLYRHKAIEKTLLSAEIKSPDDYWDNFLMKKDTMGLGKAWRFWGRGFLLSDLQFWSES